MDREIIGGFASRYGSVMVRRRVCSSVVSGMGSGKLEFKLHFLCVFV